MRLVEAGRHGQRSHPDSLASKLTEHLLKILP